MWLKLKFENLKIFNEVLSNKHKDGNERSLAASAFKWTQINPSALGLSRATQKSAIILVFIKKKKQNMPKKIKIITM